MTSEIRALEARIEHLEALIGRPNLMDTRQLCEFIGVSPRRFYENKELGNAPRAIHMSQRTVRYDMNDVLEWLEAKKI